jgi:hypothetical protein
MKTFSNSPPAVSRTISNLNLLNRVQGIHLMCLITPRSVSTNQDQSQKKNSLWTMVGRYIFINAFTFISYIVHHTPPYTSTHHHSLNMNPNQCACGPNDELLPDTRSSLLSPTYSYWIPGFLPDWTRTPTNFILAQICTGVLVNSYRNCGFLRNEYTGVQYKDSSRTPVGV